MEVTAAVSFTLAFITAQNMQRPLQNLVQNLSLFSVVISPLFFCCQNKLVLSSVGMLWI